VLTDIRTTTLYLRGFPCNRPIRTTDFEDVSEEPEFIELLFPSDDEKREGEAGTNQRSLAVLKGTRGPIMLHIFLSSPVV
jgi:hypothetical protein